MRRRVQRKALCLLVKQHAELTHGERSVPSLLQDYSRVKPKEDNTLVASRYAVNDNSCRMAMLHLCQHAYEFSSVPFGLFIMSMRLPKPIAMKREGGSVFTSTVWLLLQTLSHVKTNVGDFWRCTYDCTILEGYPC